MKQNEKNQSIIQFHKLIKEIAQGKKESLEKFYSSYGRLIYSVAVLVSKSKYLADEIVDDVLVKIWQISSSLENIKNPNGWIYSVTANFAKDKCKKEKHYEEYTDLVQEDKNFDKFIINDEFFSYIAVLNEDEQQIMILRFIQDLSFKRIAKEISKPLSTLTSIYYRALEKLKNKIKF